MRAKIDRPNLLWRVFALGGLTTMGALSISDEAWSWWERNVTDAIPRAAVQAAFWGSLGLHVGEAAVARRRATRHELDDRGAWTRTALLYGFPTLRRMKRQIAASEGEEGEVFLVEVEEPDAA